MCLCVYIVKSNPSAGYYGHVDTANGFPSDHDYA